MDAQSLGDAPSHPPDPIDWFRIVEGVVEWSKYSVVLCSTVHLTAVGRRRRSREGCILFRRPDRRPEKEKEKENENCGETM